MSFRFSPDLAEFFLSNTLFLYNFSFRSVRNKVFALVDRLGFKSATKNNMKKRKKICCSFWSLDHSLWSLMLQRNPLAPSVHRSFVNRQYLVAFERQIAREGRQSYFFLSFLYWNPCHVHRIVAFSFLYSLEVRKLLFV